MNNSSSNIRSNIEAATTSAIPPQFSATHRFGPDDPPLIELVVDSHRIPTHTVNNDNSNHNNKSDKSYLGFVSILITLNILAVTAYFYRADITAMWMSLLKTQSTTSLSNTETRSGGKDNNQSTNDYNEIVNDVLTQIASVENSRLTASAADLALEKALRKPVNETELTTADETKVTVKEKIKAKTVNVSPAALAKPASLGKPLSKPQMTISGDHIRYVITHYIEAFAKGESSELTELFRVQNVNAQYLNNMQTNFNYIVNNSDTRKASLDGLVWKYQNNSAIGQGKYYAEAQLKNNLGLQTLNADMEIIIQQVDNVPHISSFKLRKPKLTMPTNAVAALPLDPTSVDAIAPSIQELQSLVSLFTNAVESGDINAVTALFVDNVISNNQNSLAGLMEEFRQLFSTSTSRQVFIKKLRWDYTKNYAKGSGKIDVYATKNSGDIMQLIKGKVKIIAKRINNQVLITHYYHS